MQIGTRNTDEQVFIVAEIGNNHEGKPAVAEEMLRQAAACGVDAVKFQTFQTQWFTRHVDPVRYERLRRFELTWAEFARLEKIARSLGVGFFSTPLDVGSARFLAMIGDAMKVASGDNDVPALLDEAAQSRKPVILSSGMADISMIARAVERVRSAWKRYGVPAATQQLAVLHCVSAYPVPVEQANLRAIAALQHALPGVVIGYSDHTIGPEACPLAVALGARILEKHFTLDKKYSDFRDHALSADPDEMRHIVRAVRHAEVLLGDGKKRLMPAEEPVAAVARRSICVALDLPAGHVLRREDLTCLRPAGGILPFDEDRVIGRTLRRNIGFAEPIALADLE